MSRKMTNCKHCGEEIARGAKRCPKCGGKNKKPFYMRAWFWIILIILISIGAKKIGTAVKEGTSRFEKYRWPDTALASMLPQPASKYGKISYETDSMFDIDIYKISSSEFQDYIEACKENGFTEDYTKQSDYYAADNKDGYSLTLNYKNEDKTMSILIHIPEADAGQTTEATEETDTTEKAENDTASSSEENTTEAADGVDPDFKATMDSYEEFFDSYVEFMKKYNSAADTTSMMAEYSQFLLDYTDFMTKLSSIDTNSLSAGDLAYYTEVNARITKKLLEVSQ